MTKRERQRLHDVYVQAVNTTEAWKATFESCNRARLECEKECAELRKDAERYRWVRRQRHVDIAACYLFNNLTGVDSPKEFDAAIDAAIEQERKP